MLILSLIVKTEDLLLPVIASIRIENEGPKETLAIYEDYGQLLKE